MKNQDGFFGHATRNQEKTYNTLRVKGSRHGKCTDWIRENRRRRSAGLPQLRAAKADA